MNTLRYLEALLPEVNEANRRLDQIVKRFEAVDREPHSRFKDRQRSDVQSVPEPVRAGLLQCFKEELQRVKRRFPDETNVCRMKKLQERKIISHPILPQQIGFGQREAFKLLQFPQLDPKLRAICGLILIQVVLTGVRERIRSY